MEEIRRTIQLCIVSKKVHREQVGIVGIGWYGDHRALGGHISGA